MTPLGSGFISHSSSEAKPGLGIPKFAFEPLLTSTPVQESAWGRQGTFPAQAGRSSDIDQHGRSSKRR